MKEGVDGLTGVAELQARAWYQLLAQLGASARDRADLEEAGDDATVWSTLLRDVRAGCDATAWSLVIENSDSAAFLQPPTEHFERYRLEAETPDALDILLTAKNHDRKRSQAADAPPHLWLYALLTLQTAQGFAGQRNPGIARMNGGLGSRVLVDLRPGPRWGPRVKRAIRMLLNRREEVLHRVGDAVYQSEGGVALAWLEGWDADTPLSMRDLDPFFIEICRRVRLMSTPGGGIAAMAWKPSNAPRVDAKAWKGNVGDPWVPVSIAKSDTSALTVGPGGFDYRLAQRILFRPQELLRPIALNPLPDEKGKNCEIHMAVLVRGQGKTEGLHDRVIPLPGAVAACLSFTNDADDDGGEGDSTLADLSQRMVLCAGDARKVLRQSVLVYLQGPENPDFRKPDAVSPLMRYDRAVDRRFFPSLFAALEIGTDEVCRRWQRFLYDEACRQVRDVWSRMVAPRTRREKARAASEAVLIGGLRKRLPDAFPEQNNKEISA